LGLDEQIWGENGQPGDWRAMLASIDNSLRYLKSPLLPKHGDIRSGITRDRVIRSLMRFRELVISSQHQKHFKTLSAVVCAVPVHGEGRERRCFIYRLLRGDLYRQSRAKYRYQYIGCH